MSKTSPPNAAHLDAAATDLCALAKQFDEIELPRPPAIADGVLTALIQIDTRSIAIGEGGLRAGAHETITLTAGPSYPLVPPRAEVDHWRWIGYPHVLQGTRLCLFLDPDREWDPDSGMTGAIERLWGWFEEAIGGHFDARTSMFHALGGVQHHIVGADTLVVRSVPASLRPGVHPIAITQRTAHRYDLSGWGRSARQGESAGLAIVTHDPMSMGLGTTLQQLLDRVGSPVCSGNEQLLPRHGFPSSEAVRFRLERSSSRLPPGQPLRVLVAARNPALNGPAAYDLAAVVLEPASLAAAGFAPNSSSSRPEAAELTFMRPDDTRPEVHTRRDSRRPTAWFEGKWIHLIGCGALGSWIGEVIVRAGAAQITLADPGDVTSGLLVRQNYLETDVGANKADALATRLRAISDSTTVEATGPMTNLVGTPSSRPDLVIDTSVTNTISALLETCSATADMCPPLAQVATDVQTATLGIVTVTPAGSASLAAIQQTIRRHVTTRSELEDFARLWEPDDEMFAPARGCSLPTFHGSSADAMGVASTAVSLLGLAMRASIPGGYLVALPHTSANVPTRTWIEHPAPPGARASGSATATPSTE